MLRVQRHREDECLKNRVGIRVVTFRQTEGPAVAYGERREPPNRPGFAWTNLDMLAPYAHGFKSGKLEAQGAVLDKLVKSGLNRELVTIEQKGRGQGTCI